nr:uncharacterized protein LOC128695937 [Cherax quadricarinatus]
MSMKVLEDAVHVFERDTGMRVNSEKSMIMGLGTWKGEGMVSCNVVNMTALSLKICGIIYRDDLDVAREENSVRTLEKVIGCLGVLRPQHLTLAQRVIVVNVLLYSKVWHVVAVFPITGTAINGILRRVFTFLWGSRCDWLKREVVMLPVHRGGLGLLDLKRRVQCVFLKWRFGVCGCDGGNMEQVYMRLKKWYGGMELRECEILLRALLMVREQKNIRIRVLSRLLGGTCAAPLEGLFPMYSWENIWLRFSKLKLRPRVREVMFRFLHGILPSGALLRSRRVVEGGGCGFCGGEDTAFHVVYFCEGLENVRGWLGRVVRH